MQTLLTTPSKSIEILIFACYNSHVGLLSELDFGVCVTRNAEVVERHYQGAETFDGIDFLSGRPMGKVNTGKRDLEGSTWQSYLFKKKIFTF